MKCQSCGHTVVRRAQFCAHCGAPVIPRVHQDQAAPQQPRWVLYSALLASGILLGAIIVYFVLNKQQPADAHTHFDGTLNGAALAQQYPAVYEAAAQFICPCGTCTDGLEVCDCNMEKGASEVRTLIYDLLQQHQAPHVIELIAQQYGHRKTGATPTLSFPPSDSPKPGWMRP